MRSRQLFQRGWRWRQPSGCSPLAGGAGWVWLGGCLRGAAAGLRTTLCDLTSGSIRTRLRDGRCQLFMPPAKGMVSQWSMAGLR